MRKSILKSDAVQKLCNPSYHYEHARPEHFKFRVLIHLKGYGDGLQTWPLDMRINFRAGKWLQHDLELSEREVKQLIPAYTTSRYPAPVSARW